MFFKNKKGGADASAAAALIGVITFLIILYILFIPPEEREKILGDEEDLRGVEEGETKILLSESPERLLPAEKRGFEKLFSAITVYVGEEGIKLKEINTLEVSRTIFNNRKIAISFDVSDLDNIKDSLLNFLVEENRGKLIIKLNGAELLNKKLEQGNIDPIELKGKLLKGINTLEIEASSPKLLFWRRNRYELESVLVTADMVKKETQESSLNFLVNIEERENMEKVKLRYLPECVEESVDPLTISINNYPLYSSVPADCNIPAR
ncbi:MAG: hypothetical protein V3V78_01300, partial [Candidatus Woesearchaeota archaeon]